MKKIILVKLTFLMCIAFSICNAGDENAKSKNGDSTVTKEDTLKIVFFGDSITAYRGKLFVASKDLSERLSNAGISNCVFNAGIGGNTTEMGRARFANDVLNYNPDIVVIAFGTNDSAIDVGNNKTEPRVSISRYVENLKYFIAELKKNNTLVIFDSPPPMYLTKELKKLYGKEPYLSKGFNFMLDQYVEKERETALEAGCCFIDINKAFRDAAGGTGEKLNDYMPDGMHPNEKGQKIIADNIWKLWQEKPEILKHRANARMEILNIEKPEKNASSPSGKFDFSIKAPSSIEKDSMILQARSKGYTKKAIGNGWTDIPFNISGGNLSGSIELKGEGLFALEFRAIDKNSKDIKAIGITDPVSVQ